MNLPNDWSSSSRIKVAMLSAAVLGIGALALIPLATTRTTAPPAASTPIETKLASIPVEGMICLSCAATIKQKVKALPGVVGAQVHFANRVVVINYAASQPDVSVRAAATINSLGYKAGEPAVAHEL